MRKILLLSSCFVMSAAIVIGCGEQEKREHIRSGRGSARPSLGVTTPQKLTQEIQVLRGDEDKKITFEELGDKEWLLSSIMTSAEKGPNFDSKILYTHRLAQPGSFTRGEVPDFKFTRAFDGKDPFAVSTHIPTSLKKAEQPGIFWQNLVAYSVETKEKQASFNIPEDASRVSNVFQAPMTAAPEKIYTSQANINDTNFAVAVTLRRVEDHVVAMEILFSSPSEKRTFVLTYQEKN